MSAALVEQFSGDFDPTAYEDEYQRELRLLIEEKLEKGDAVDTEATFGERPAESAGGDVVDLMEALRRSLEMKRARATAAGEAAGEPAEEPVQPPKRARRTKGA